MSIIGYVDSISATGISGWAADTERPAEAVTVEIVSGDKMIAAGLADIYREDVHAAGVGGGRHGFTIPVAGADTDADIACRVGDTLLLSSHPAGGDADADRVSAYWDNIDAVIATMAPRARWPESGQIVRDYNARVYGRPIDGPTNQGLFDLFRETAPSAFPIGRAVSVGCGSGMKELLLLRDGVVLHFDLFDVSAESLKAGLAFARELGVEDKVTFVHGRDFMTQLGSGYDLVYWDNALHHMLDSDAAVRWSRDVLKPGGWFVMNDFVGANRFQWSDETYAIADIVRSALPDRCFHNPVNPAAPFPRKVHRATLLEMEYDPSEAADSETIIPAILAHFPDALVRHVGGTIYHMALNDVLTNIPEGSELLAYLLGLDRAIDIPHYAVALAQKTE